MTATATTTPSFALFGISGHIYHFGNLQPVPNVEVAFSGPAGAGSVFTDSGGRYDIPDIGGAAWSIVPRKLDTNAAAAVSSIDATIALQTAVGLLAPTSERRLACDSNGDGRVSALDASIILRWRVGLIGALPVVGVAMCNSAWVFVPTPTSARNQTFRDPVLSGSACAMGAIDFSPLIEQADGQDFLAALLGDCNGSWAAP